MNCSQLLHSSIRIFIHASTLLAYLFVLIGGIAYLLQVSNQIWSIDTLLSPLPPFDFNYLFASLGSKLTALTWIQFGLGCLVSIHILHVALLAWFYLSQHDFWFFSFAMLIFMILIFSLLRL